MQTGRLLQLPRRALLKEEQVLTDWRNKITQGINETQDVIWKLEDARDALLDDNNERENAVDATLKNALFYVFGATFLNNNYTRQTILPSRRLCKGTHCCYSDVFQGNLIVVATQTS